MTVQLLHVADLHFGGLADIRQIEALERMIPDLRPDAVVVAGDLSQRARHGEFQRARAFVNAAATTAPTLVIPGNHDVQWWWRPLVPFAKEPMYRKYRGYFGDDLAPTLTIPGGAVIASALTSHGVAWGSVTTSVRDLAVKGHLPKREMLRVQRLFAETEPALARVLVVHHNVLRGEISQRMGLAHWRRAQQRLVEAGADVVLCGHDHQEGADVLGGKVVVSTAGTLSTRSRGGRPSCFNFVTIEPTAVHITFFRWEAERGRFRASDTFAFGRGHGHAERRDLATAPSAQR
ncbi:MAG TPA: metallophosphoesterase [Gemmatimonadales bacterium]|nr:metallophosphoesterase [Gemmatimonadales bacterium]